MSSENKEKKIEYLPFIGTVEHYVGRSALDYYSWGHLDMGIAAFLLISLFITVTEALIGPSILDWWFVMVLVIIFGFIWELIENTILHRWGWRPSNRRDSIVNAVWDIFLVCVGGLLMWLFQWIIMEVSLMRGTFFYIAGIISFIFALFFYFIGFYITNENTKIARRERKKVIS